MESGERGTTTSKPPRFTKASGWVGSSGVVGVGVKCIADALGESTTVCFIDVGELGSPHFSNSSGMI
jgi:hypothetical protein